MDRDELLLNEQRNGSRTAATSKMERFVIIVNGLSKMKRFVIIVNGWKPLTITTKRSIFDIAAVLDPPLEPLLLSDDALLEERFYGCSSMNQILYF